MEFVELNRGFLPLGKGDDPDTDISRFWNHKYSGAVFWPLLRQYPRVVLLAEASSGKTREFRHQVDALRKERHAAFFVRIEELADEGFEAALDPSDLEAFYAWHRGGAKAWFFLDSLDEARLNRRSFDTALRNLARVIGSALNRAHIFISCRVSDWQGDKDRAAIGRLLPSYRAPDDDEAAGDPLLDPIFDKDAKKQVKKGKEDKPVPIDLQIFRITPLVTDQYRLLARACGVTNVVEFSNAIVQQGLDMFTERPGDVIDLANYWLTHNQFDAFEKMTEHAVTLKLREEDSHRADNEALSDSKAREGAELLAAALTLGRSFTLRVPSPDPDPSLSAGAIDPGLILPSWSPAERNALCRRAAFAPATYGRIRFHHRGTQEYLTAQYFLAMLERGCPIKDIWSLIFVERYGVETIVPTLQPVAAWLALWRTDICDEVIKREPLVLIRHGDPASLTVPARERLLNAFAAKQAAGEIYNDSLDHRALWMFADKRLDKSIRSAWNANKRSDFRLDLLRLIREGEIYSCSDLALQTVRDAKGGEYHLTVAADILRGENKAAHLNELATIFKKNAKRLNSRAAAAFALAAFPAQLSVKDLLKAISEAELDKKDRTDGIGYHLADLYELCPDESSKEQFLLGLASLALAPPYAESYQQVSKKYFELAKGLEAVARVAVPALAGQAPSKGTVSLLTAVERADRHLDLDDSPSVAEGVRSNLELNRALFWADVRIERSRKGETPPIRYWQLYFHGVRLWHLNSADLKWLLEDLRSAADLQDRQLALSAIQDIYGLDLAKHEKPLRKIIGSVKELNDDLTGYLAPPAKPSKQLSDMQKRHEAHARAQAIQTEINKSSWREFHERIVKTPGDLRDPAKLRTWENGAATLFTLTTWLNHRVDNGSESAAKEWRLLSDVFGQEIAENYCAGMKTLWRVTKPQGRQYNADGSFSFMRTSSLSIAGIGIEASEDRDWVAQLPNAEVKRAFEHGISEDHNYPEWIDDLLAEKAALLLPELKSILETEWQSKDQHSAPFLYRLARGQVKIGPDVQGLVIDMLSGLPPPALKNLEYGVRILKKLDLGKAIKEKLYALGLLRLSECADDKKRDYAIRYIAWLMALDVNAASKVFSDWIAAREKAVPGYGEWAFGALYERNDPIIYGVLEGASVPTLEEGLNLAYSYVRPEDDVRHEGVFSPGPRDAAEEGRNTILSALIARPGPDAYRALQRLSKSPAFKMREHRFRELAKGKAERDTEFPAWSEAEVLTFHERYASPVKTGHDLLNVTSDVLADIEHALSRDDVSSRALLLRAANEDEVRNWLVEQMNFRAKGRFLATRESEIAFEDRPDVIVSSTAAPVSVAFEIKHGGMNWTVTDFELALTSQLAQDYLKPAERRHGILVISYHGHRTWRHPRTRAVMLFDDVIARLRKIAATIHSNEDGAIAVRVFGINAAQEKPEKAHRRAGKHPKAGKPAKGGRPSRRSTRRKPGGSNKTTSREPT